MTKEQAMQALEEVGRKDSSAYAELAALEELNKAFKNAVIEPVFGLIEDIATAKVISGTRVLLSNLGGDRELFHEGFHLITNHLPKESKAAYAALRKRLNDKVVRVQSGKTFVDKKGKDLTDREADEYLAYQFEDYMLLGETDIPAANKTLFDKIKSFIQSFLKYFGINIQDFNSEDAVDKLFKFAQNAKDLQLIDKVTSEDIYRIYHKTKFNPDGSPQVVSSKDATRILSYMNYQFFRLLANPTLPIDKFKTTEVRIVPSAEDIYKYTESGKDIYNRLKEKIRYDAANVGSANAGTAEKFAKGILDWDLLDEFIGYHKQFIDSYGLKSLEEITTSDESQIESTSEVMNDVAGPATPSSEINWKTRMPDAIKLLIASIPSVIENETDLAGNLKETKQIKFDQAITSLQNELSNLVYFEDMLSKLEAKSKQEDKEYFKYIIQALNADDKFTTKLKLDFFSFFAKDKQDVIKTLLDPNDITILNAFESLGGSRALTQWKEDIITDGIYTEDEDGTYYIQLPKEVLEDITNVDKAFEVLENIGISIDFEARKAIKGNAELSDKFITNYKNWITDVKKAGKILVEDLFVKTGKINSSRLEVIAGMASILSSDVLTLSFVNQDGKAEYAVTLNTGISNTIRDIKKEIPTHLIPWSKDNLLGNPLTIDSKFQSNTKKLDISNLKGVESNEDGVKTTKADNPTFIVNYINTVLSGINSLHRSSVRSVEYAIRFPINTDGVIGEDLFATQFMPYLKNELLAIQLFENANRGKGLLNYTKNAKDLRSLDFINTKDNTTDEGRLTYIDLNKFVQLGKGKTTPELWDVVESFIKDNKDSLNSQLRAWYSNQVATNLSLFKENKIIVDTSEIGLSRLPGLSRNLLTNLKVASERIKQKEGKKEIEVEVFDTPTVRRIVDLFTFNDIIGKQEQIVNIFGDLAFYKNKDAFNKRANLFTGTKQSSIVDKGLLADMDKHYPRLDGTKRNENFKLLVIADLIKDSDFVEGYKKMNIADAQSWVSPDGYRDLMLRSDPNNWSEEIEESWQHQAQLFAQHLVNKGLMTQAQFNTKFKQHLPNDAKKGITYYQKDAINVLGLKPLNIQKPQGVGPLIHKATKGLYVPHSVKTSVVMLNTLDYSADSPLIKLAEQMYIDGIDLVQSASASKITGLQPQPVMVFEDGKVVFKPYDKEFISELGWKYYGIQNQIENKYKKKTTYATQLRKQLLNNLKDIFSPEQRLRTETEYHRLTNLRVKKAVEALINKLALADEKDYKKITEKLLDNFKNKSISNNELEGIKIALEDRDLRKFDTLISKNKIENVIFSFFRADVIMKKVNGDMFIQMSNAGTGIELKPYLKGADGTIAAEVAVPLPLAWYKFVLDKFGSLEKFNEAISKPNQNIISEELLTFVANRIPCQAPNLIDVFKVKQFLHPSTGNKIILPEEHTTKTGSDFDVDKLLSYLNSNYIDLVENKIKYIGYPESLNRSFLSEEYDRLYIKKDLYKEAVAEITENNLNLKDWINNFENIESAESLFTNVTINDAQISSILSRKNIDSIDFYRFNVEKVTQTKLSKEEFINNWLDKPVDDYVSFEHIDNRINEIAKEIVLSPEYYKQLMTPTDEAADIVKKEMLKYKPNFGEKWSDILTFKHNLEKTRDARVAGEGIALLAKQQSSHSLMQQFPVRINAFLKNKFYPKDSVFYIGKSTEDQNGIRISDIQSGVQTGYLDMENNNFVLYGNSYGEFLNTFDFLLRTSPADKKGPSIKQIIAFFAQPYVSPDSGSTTSAVKMYLDFMGSAKGLYYDVNGFKDSKSVIVDNIFTHTRYKGLTEERTNKNGDTEVVTIPMYKLAEIIFKGGEEAQEAKNKLNNYLDSMPDLNAEFFKELSTNIEHQGYVLDLLLYYKEHSNYLSNLMQITQPDAKFQKNRAGIKIIDAYKEDLMESGYFDTQDVEKLIDSTFIKEFENVRGVALNAYSEFFLTDNIFLQDKFKQLILSKIRQKKPISEIEPAIDAIENYFVTYITNKLSKTTEMYERIFTGENNLAKRIYAAKKTDLINNPVIKELYHKIKDKNKKQNREYGFDYIKFHNKRMDVFQTDAMVEGVLELYDNAETRELAEDIVWHSIISSGVQYTPDSYQTLIPNEIYFKLVKPSIKNYIDNYVSDKETVDRVWQQFMWELRANRPMDSKVVNTTSYLFASGKQKPTYNPNGYKSKAFTQDYTLTQQLSVFGANAVFAMPKELYSPSEDGQVYVGMLYKNGNKKEPALWKYTGITSRDGSPVYVRIPNQGEQNKLFEVQDYRINGPEDIISLFNTAVEVNAVEFVEKPEVETKPVQTSTKEIDFQEEPTSGYRNRTVKNASADVTIAFAVDFNSAGEKLTKKSVLEQGKKYVPIDVSKGLEISQERIDKIIEFINRMEPSLYGFSLNIAGNGIYTMKGKYTQEQIDTFTYETLNKILNSPKLQNTFESIRSGGQTGFDEAGAKAGIKLGLPTTILAPKGWTFRNINGQDISNEEQFKARFEDSSEEQVNNSNYIDQDFKYFGAVYQIQVENGLAQSVLNLKKGDSETNSKFIIRAKKILDAWNENPNVDKQNGKQFREFKVKEEINNQEFTQSQPVNNTFSKDGRSIETAFPLTQGQNSALNKLIDFSKSRDKAITLQGPAGTGKTAVIGYLQKYLGGGTKFVYMAPTHAASAELAFATVKTGNKTLPMTVASAFRIAKDPDTGVNVAMMTKKLSDKIGYGNNIIVVDEVSMLANKDMQLMIEALKERGNIKIIYMGDKLQIPEVDPSNPENKQVSKAFTQFDQVYLTEVKRTDSPSMLKVLSNLRKNTNALIPQVENTDQIKFVGDQEFDKLIVETFKKDPEETVLISYTNAGVTASNSKIREVLGRTGDVKKGDIIVGYLGYSSKQIEKGGIANSVRYTVTDVKKEGSLYDITVHSNKLETLKSQGVEQVNGLAVTTYYQLSETDSFRFDALTDKDFESNNKAVSNVMKSLYLAKQAALKNPRAWSDFYAAQQSVAKFFSTRDLGGNYIYNPSTDKMEIFNSTIHRGIDAELKVEKGIDFGHAITIHKSQGSTVKNVFYDTATLSKGTSSKLFEGEKLIGSEKHSLNYVGMSRASKLLVVKNTDPSLFYKAEDVDSNVNYSKSVNYILKATQILQSEKALEWFRKSDKNQWRGDLFWNKLSTDLQIPKEQVELLKSLNTNNPYNREELLTALLANYSYTVEVNTTTTGITAGKRELVGYDENGDDIYRNIDSKEDEPTNHYSNMTVPGGTNYTENEIATPLIIPSIKGHAQFATDNGIGWFRSDEKQSSIDLQEQQEEEEYQIANNPNYVKGSIRFESGEGSKTRRILEVQSDLFQKGRDKEQLTGKDNQSKLEPTQRPDLYVEDEYEVDMFRVKTPEGVYFKTQNDYEFRPSGGVNEKTTKEIYNSKIRPANDFDTKGNQFLQLLNKDNNWVTFFVKSIIQDSAKKGYEKVLFPSGNTASKVEGHTTLEEFKKQKEDRIKELENKLK
jgi:hypothetical protein